MQRQKQRHQIRVDWPHVPGVTCVMPAGTPIAPEIKAVALKLAAEGLSTSEIGRQLGLSRVTVKNWLAVPAKIKDMNRLLDVGVQNAIRKHEHRLSSVVRDQLAKVIGKQVSLLHNAPPSSVNQLRTTPERQGLAAVAKTITEAATTVFGWTPENAGGRDFSPGDLSRLEAVDIETTCGQDTATGGGGEQATIGDAPQSTDAT